MFYDEIGLQEYLPPTSFLKICCQICIASYFRSSRSGMSVRVVSYSITEEEFLGKISSQEFALTFSAAGYFILREWPDCI